MSIHSFNAERCEIFECLTFSDPQKFVWGGSFEVQNLAIQMRLDTLDSWNEQSRAIRIHTKRIEVIFQEYKEINV